MLELYVRIMNWLRSEGGQDLIEYALLVSLVAVVCIAAITLGGQAISNFWDTIQAALASVAS